MTQAALGMEMLEPSQGCQPKTVDPTLHHPYLDPSNNNNNPGACLKSAVALSTMTTANRLSVIIAAAERSSAC